jgi:hypothetical protein
VRHDGKECEDEAGQELAVYQMTSAT